MFKIGLYELELEIAIGGTELLGIAKTAKERAVTASAGGLQTTTCGGKQASLVDPVQSMRPICG